LNLFHDTCNDTIMNNNHISPPSSLLSSRTPTRTSVIGAVGTSILNQPLPGVREQMTFHTWCHTRQYDPQTIYNDDALLKLLLQMPPNILSQQTSTVNVTLENTDSNQETFDI
jgi:hypothetical protein